VTAGPVSSALAGDIQGAIGDFPRDLIDLGGRPPLAIKYISPRRAGVYRQPGHFLRVSDTPGFTWGRAAYVTPIAYPLSAAIFGRIGVVARFNPAQWRTFDATVDHNQQLYLRWVQAQPLYRVLMMSAHPAYINQSLRDAFRLEYGIDCVLFRPDQSNPRYTRLGSDIWMAVTEWRTRSGDRRIATGQCSRFQDAKLTVVVEEEFEDRMGGIHREGLLKLNTPRPPGDPVTLIRLAWEQDEIYRVPA
jgi:hypothetical protein